MKCGAETGIDISVNYEAEESDSSNEEIETVLIEGECNQIIDGLQTMGKAQLTNKRFIYFKHSTGKLLAFGVLSALLTSGKHDYELLISEISNVEFGRWRLAKTVTIYTKSGNQYIFGVTKHEKWKDAFAKVIK